MRKLKFPPFPCGLSEKGPGGTHLRTCNASLMHWLPPLFLTVENTYFELCKVLSLHENAFCWDLSICDPDCVTIRSSRNGYWERYWGPRIPQKASQAAETKAVILNALKYKWIKVGNSLDFFSCSSKSWHAFPPKPSMLTPWTPPRGTPVNRKMVQFRLLRPPKRLNGAGVCPRRKITSCVVEGRFIDCSLTHFNREDSWWGENGNSET